MHQCDTMYATDVQHINNKESMTPDELVQAYLEQRRHPKSTLEAWIPHLQACLKRGMSYREIADFLRTQSVSTTHSSVYRFIHAKKRSSIFGQWLSDQPPVRPSSVVQATDKQSSSSDSSQSESIKSTDSASKTIPSFEWDPSREQGKTRW